MQPPRRAPDTAGNVIALTLRLTKVRPSLKTPSHRLMNPIDRRTFLRLSGAGLSTALLPLSIRKALAIPAAQRTGTLMDVQHVVILMQENRAFDHYFGTLRGVRGFGDRFTVPQAGGRSVWQQRLLGDVEVLPYHLDSTQGNAQRVEGTPHSWSDAHLAWNKGRFGHWPLFKHPQSMGYYEQAEVSFQTALAEAFTICDAYHCAIHSSTNPNRLFLFTGTNDPQGRNGGPAIDNTNDDLGPPEDGYTWTTYPERLEQAGISWKVYQDLDDNFTDNPLEGFRNFRDAYYNDPNSPLLKGVSTTLHGSSLDGLRNDVLGGVLPQVSWIVAPAEYSEHPGPSSPVQGGWYMQQVLDALTADPAVFSKTVLLVMFDENDGFFDHLPPPSAPSLRPDGSKAGASTVDDQSERHTDRQVYGPGPRVPLLAISPWSRGGWVNSQIFDHTSVIRFLEARFGVAEPNISAWRRAVCGDLRSVFNFATPNDEQLPPLPTLSQQEADAIRAAQEALPQVPVPYGRNGSLPQQAAGFRPSRALPYALQVHARIDAATRRVHLQFVNTGKAGAVFHVYDRLDLDDVPRRYAVEAGKSLGDHWPAGLLRGGRYDLWVLGPNGFHRNFQGRTGLHGEALQLHLSEAPHDTSLRLRVHNPGDTTQTLTITANAYRNDGPWVLQVPPQGSAEQRWPLQDSLRWYDFTARQDDGDTLSWRFAGRLENGQPSISDPAMGLR